MTEESDRIWNKPITKVSMTSNELPIPKLNSITKMMFPTAQIRINAGRCPLCNNKINGVDDFKDELSIREYSISGMCAACQNKTFN